MMPERDCVKCSAQQKADWGCKAYRWVKDDGEVEWLNPAQVPLSWEDGEDWWACPRQDLHENPQMWGQMLLYYGMFKAGFLPDNGAVSTQSAFAVEVFRIFDAANAKADEAKDAAAKVKANRAEVPRGRHSL